MKAGAAFSGFSVDDADKAKQFYSKLPGLELDNDDGARASPLLSWRCGLFILSKR